MAKNLIPASPTKNGALRQAESIAVDLPPPETKRWVPRRKAAIVNAVHSGVVSLEEICRRYNLSGEEFIAWQRAIETHGVAGLRVTRLQVYRDAPLDPPPVPAATLAVIPQRLGGRHTEAGTRAAKERTVGRTHPPSPQTAPPLSQIEQRRPRCRDDAPDHPIGRRRAPGIGYRAEVRSVSSPFEMRFEDAVTKDGGPLHLPRPEPMRSLYGCATARSHE
jgi:hypothetical protein